MRRLALAALAAALLWPAPSDAALNPAQLARQLGEMWRWGLTVHIPALFPAGLSVELGRPITTQDLAKLAKAWALNGDFGTAADRKEAAIAFVKNLYKADTGKDSLSAADLHDFCEHWLEGIEVGLCAAVGS